MCNVYAEERLSKENTTTPRRCVLGLSAKMTAVGGGDVQLGDEANIQTVSPPALQNEAEFYSILLSL